MRFSTSTFIASSFSSLALLSDTVTDAPTLEARDGNTCSYVNNNLWYSYTISLLDDRSIDDSCGGGFLDNLCGRRGGGVTAISLSAIRTPI